MFEESIRVPLLVRWPGVVKPGTVIEEMVTNVDTFATILGDAGVPLPADAKQHGVDFSPLLCAANPCRTRDVSSASTTCTTPASRSCG